MRIKMFITFAIFASLFYFTQVVRAEDSPNMQTVFYFQQKGIPFNQPVKFTATCYGVSMFDEFDTAENKQLLKISELSEICSSYGCKYDFNVNGYKKNLKYCDLEGDVNGNKFTVSKFMEPPTKELKCHQVMGNDWTEGGGNGEYYKSTPQYTSCMDELYQEKYPNGGEYVCSKYRIEVSADRCAPPNYNCWTDNGKYYMSGYEFERCANNPAWQEKEKLCRSYLIDVTSKLEKNDSGYPFDQICETTINVPDSIIANVNIDQSTINTQSTAQRPATKNFFIRLWESIKCSWLNLFGKNC